MNILGIMSGTSMDGVDYALCAIDSLRCELLDLWSVDYFARLRKAVAACANGSATSHELAQLHHDLGRFYAKHAESGESCARPELVGLHGQTVFHHPAVDVPATVQIGEPAYLAQALGVPVVSNFRVGDLAAGGQGAPLATAFHVRVFRRKGRHVCVNNLGGISNVTSIEATQSGARSDQDRILSYDTGPANVLLDLAVRHFSKGRRAFDDQGREAGRGKVCEPLVESWLKHPYFRQPPPKSTGPEVFGETFFAKALRQLTAKRLSNSDVMATFTEFTARSLVRSYADHLKTAPDEVVLCGGGAANPVLVAAIERNLRELFPEVKVTSSVDHGWPLKSVEPAAFALLAWLRWRRKPGNLPATTGAYRAVLLGQVTEV